MKINLWKDMFTFIFVERDVELVRRATLIIPVGWLHGTGRQESKRNLRSGRMHICQEKRKWKEWKTDKRREVKWKERPFGRTLKRKKSEVRITPATELVYVTWSFHWNSKNYVAKTQWSRKGCWPETHWDWPLIWTVCNEQYKKSICKAMRVLQAGSFY